MLEIIQRLIILLCLNVIFYTRTLKYRYVSDDIGNFKHPPKTKNQWHKAWLWLIGWYKAHPRYDHLLTLVIHAINTCLIYLAFGHNDVSFVAASLFMVNPATKEGSVWISGRGYTLSLMGLLLVFVIPWLAPAWLFAAIWFGVGTFNPIILLVTKFWWATVLFAPLVWWSQWKRQKAIYTQKRNIEAVDEDKKINLSKLILAIKTYGFYLALSIVPFRITFYHSFLQSCAGNEIMRGRAYTMKDKFFFFGILGLALTAASIGTPYFFGLFWFFIAVAPFCNFVRINQEVTERFVYIPMAGIMYVLSQLIAPYPVLIAVFATMYAVKMWFTMPMFRDDYYILEHSVVEDSKAWYAWHMRALKRWDTQSYKEALIMWVMARLVSPKEFKLNMNIAMMLFMLHKPGEAEAFLKIAEQNIIPGQEERAKKTIEDTRNGTYGVIA